MVTNTLDRRTVNILIDFSESLHLFISVGDEKMSFKNVWEDPQHLFNCRLCLKFKLS